MSFHRTIRTIIRLSAVLAVVALAKGCGDGESPSAPPMPEPARPTTVTVSPATDELTALGQAIQLTAEVRDQNDRVMAGATVTWTTSANSVATVDAAGLVTAVGNGTATITASAGSASGSAAVTVAVGVPPAPDLVVGSPSVSNSSPDAGASFTLSATVRNRGDGSSSATTLRYYRSINSIISTGDTQVGTDAVSALSASGTSAESIDLTAPSSAGTYYYGACVDDVTGESDTSNNCSSAVTVAVGVPPAPDLVVGSPSVSNSSPDAGASFTLSATVRNQGDGSSSATTLRYYRSINNRITTDDTEVGTDAVSALSASGTSAESIGLTAPSSAGTYYYGACVNSVTGESDTSNNCSSAVTIAVGVPPAPDLVVGLPAVSNSSPVTGASFTLSATVRNQGSGPSAATTLRYYRSTDARITTGDTEVGTDAVSALAASGTSDESIGLTAPSSAGTYYYGACVNSVTGESDTSNNCSSAVTVTVGVASAPDLVVESPSVSDSSPIAGASFTLSATVRNQGDGPSAATTLRYYRSTDARITTGDTEVDTDAVGALAASGTSDESIDLTAPSSAGTYYYGACVNSVTGESDTSNNCSSAVTIAVGVPPAPDLVVGSPSVSNSTPVTGASFTLSATVRNQGSGPSAATTLRYYRSTDATISGTDTQVDTDAVSALAASGTSDESIGLTAPASAGRYYYGACVDDVTGESDTSNNCSDAVTVTVGGRPDLVVESPSVDDDSPETGGSFTLSATVSNDGDGGSATTTLRYYRSADATISATDTEVGTDAVGALSASATSAESISLTAPASAGTYYYGACVDSVDGESTTDNNCSDGVEVEVSGGGAGTRTYQTGETISTLPTGFWTPDRVSGASFQFSSGQVTITFNNGGYIEEAGIRYTCRASGGCRIAGRVVAEGTIEASGGGGSNRAPETVGSISDRTMTAGQSATLDASSYFSDPDGDRLTYSARSSSSDVASAGVSGSTVTIDAVSQGTATIRVTATDPGGLSAEQSFTVTVGGGGGAPDLVVQSPAVDDDTPDAGASFTFSATVRNRGEGQSGSTTLRYYRSTNSTISTTDTQVGTDAVGALSASGTSDESIGLTAPASVGTYYYGACVDAVTGESDTSNNCSASVQVDVTEPPPPSTPDLVVGSPSVDDDSPETGGSFTLSATVSNNGDGGSAATTLRYYRSADATISGTDTQVGTDAVGALAASATSDESIDLTAPASVGTYYYGACVDAVTGESDTSNNCSSAVTIAVGVRPDLVVESPSVSDSSPDAGASFTLSATVRNSGDGGSVATTLRYYRSINNRITTGDTEVGTDAVGALAASGTSDESIALTAPASGGTYYYGACVDDVTGETDTSDNCSSAVTVTVTIVGPAPDLVVGSPSVSDSNPDAGASFTLSATVRNSGDGGSVATTLRYYRSTNSIISTIDTEVGTDAVSALLASATSAESIGLTAPASAGTYYYGACVDDVTGESDSNNNCSSAVTVTVGQLGDPITGSITTCEGNQVGPSLWSVTIEGTLTASRSVLAVRIEGSVGGDFVGFDIIGDMTAGESVNFSITGYLTSPPTGSCGVHVEWIEIGSSRSQVGSWELSLPQTR